MYYKVRIKKAPKAQSGLEVKMRAGLGFNANQLSWPVMAGEFSEPDLSERKTLSPIPREFANLEAEVGETAVTNLNADGIPEHYTIGGKRHYAGGTPLNLPDNSYIFSRDNSMKIKDKDILEQFGITSSPKGGVSPAEIAKRYDINKFKKTLLDKNSDAMSRKTAEIMIQNYIVKLGKLALIQESMKGFPEGIPALSMAYLESMGIDPKEILPDEQQTEQLAVAPQTEDEMQNDQSGDQMFSDLPVMQARKGAEILIRTPHYLRTYAPGGGVTDDGGYKISYTPQGGKKVERVIPPLSPDQSLAKDDFDPRLSEKSNQKFNKFKQAILSDANIATHIVDELKKKVEEDLANGRLTADAAATILAKKPEEILNQFFDYQKQNWALYDADIEFKKMYGDKESIFDKKWGLFDTGKNAFNNNIIVSNILQKRGWTTNDLKLNSSITKELQVTNKAIAATMTDPKYKEVFKDFKLPHGGKYRKGYSGSEDHNVVNPFTEEATFSDTDGVYGDDTSNVRYTYKDEDPGGEEPCKCEDGTTPKRLADGTCPCKSIKKTCPPCPDGTTPEPDASGKCPCSPIEAPKDSPWWIQDIIRTTGAFGELARVKKYMPWQATPQVDYIEPTFYSPERELAANAEQLAIGAEGAAQFTGPQAYNARFAQLSGKAAANAADIMGRYSNLNVGVANETEKMNVDIFNDYAKQKASAATLLFDKATIANQQFDASKARAREKLGNAYVQGITNAADAFNLNQMYPDYAINPLTGGKLVRKPPSRQVTPTAPSDYGTEYKEFVGKLPADTTWEERTRLWEIYKKQNADAQYDDYEQRRKAWEEQSKYPGYGSGYGFPGGSFI